NRAAPPRRHNSPQRLKTSSDLIGKYGETGAGSYDATRRNTSDALVPPKPNEFDKATLISRFTALCGARSIAVSTDGLSRLIVGGATPSRMASSEKIASTAPAAPSRWPTIDLVDDMVILPAALPTMR